MKRRVAAIIIAGGLLAGCATPASSPSATPTEGGVLPTATAVRPAEVATATATATPALTPSPTVTHTAEPTNTPTPVPTYTLSGTVFFDYNGNGLRDEGEPPIERVPIQVAGLSTTSGPNGTYSIVGVPAGSQEIHVESPSQEPATAFRYTNRFLGWVDIPAYEMNGVSVAQQHLADTEFQPIDHPLGLVLANDQTLDVALMQGFLTLPYRSFDSDLVFEIHGFDHDPRVAHVVDYAGDTRMSQRPGQPGTGDSHPGWDHGLPIGTPLIAAAPGGRVEVLVSENGSLNLVVKHALYLHGGHEVQTVYGHLSKALVDPASQIARGQIIAASGMSGTSSPHLHLDLLFGLQNPPEPDDYLRVQYQKDPYGVLPGVEVSFPIERYSSWTVFNDPRIPF